MKKQTGINQGVDIQTKVLGLTLKYIKKTQQQQQQQNGERTETPKAKENNQPLIEGLIVE